eukprot:TRINITY_DN12876_c0_g1_i1.p1 TRINITY_DN12876_c0_g1~~TRINITY_DN12876_c0_g1_i1.p1  ORF type:complete len:138 (-),score=38.65 TRINITY_DN12876_c0_g1_i1:99-512(-)
MLKKLENVGELFTKEKMNSLFVQLRTRFALADTKFVVVAVLATIGILKNVYHWLTSESSNETSSTPEVKPNWQAVQNSPYKEYERTIFWNYMKVVGILLAVLVGLKFLNHIRGPPPEQPEEATGETAANGEGKEKVE